MVAEPVDERTAAVRRSTSRAEQVYWQVLLVWQQAMRNAYKIICEHPGTKCQLAATSWLLVCDA